LESVNDICAVIVALEPVSVIEPPALEPFCASVPFTDPVPATASVIVPT
jgi:hypothetical protein